MYNPTLKKQFIESKPKSFTVKLKALFRNSCEMETELNKDLYQFNQEELELLFELLNLVNFVDTYNCIKYYLDYCKEKGLIENNIILP